ncbi:hypothetical protein HDU91_004352, partial [Kappamyces sp. JEL0680]
SGKVLLAKKAALQKINSKIQQKKPKASNAPDITHTNSASLTSKKPHLRPGQANAAADESGSKLSSAPTGGDELFQLRHQLDTKTQAAHQLASERDGLKQSILEKESEISILVEQLRVANGLLEEKAQQAANSHSDVNAWEKKMNDQEFLLRG